jgi:sucrose-6F-phosphate phosphohydrolase
MNNFNPQPKIKPRVLATDLDGTLIPLPGRENNVADLKTIASARASENFEIVFATGRHFESAMEAMETYKLPEPDWIVCDVGSSIYHKVGHDFIPYEPYVAHLDETTGGVDRQTIQELIASIKGMELQSPDHQQRFKISYQCASEKVEELIDAVSQKIEHAVLPFSAMGSVDPFLNCGLIDVLPAGVTKAYALLWLATHADFMPDEVIYSGDSGNDLAALTSGFRAIIVGNASTGLEGKVRSQLAARNLEARLYVAQSEATSAVLEGCRHFKLIP